MFRFTAGCSPEHRKAIIPVESGVPISGWQLGEGKHSYKFTYFCAVMAPDCHIKHFVAILLCPDFVIPKEEGLSRVVDDTNFIIGDFDVLSGKI